MPDPIELNPAETDSTAKSYVPPITTLPDTSWVLVPKTDPDNPGETIYEKITIANLKTAMRTIALAETVSNLTTNWTNIGSPLADTNIVSVSVKFTLDSKQQHDGDIIVVGAIGTTGDWIPLKGGESGSRLEIKKLSTGQLQIRRQGPISAVRVDLVKLI